MKKYLMSYLISSIIGIVCLTACSIGNSVNTVSSENPNLVTTVHVITAWMDTVAVKHVNTRIFKMPTHHLNGVQ